MLEYNCINNKIPNLKNIICHINILTMDKNSNVIKDFISKNIITVLAYITIISIILPLESIGFSNYITEVISNIKSNSLKLITKPLIIICIIFIVTKFFYLIKQYFEANIHTNLVKHIREKMFSAFLHKLSKNYKEADLGNIISKLNIIPYIYEDVLYDVIHTILPYGFTIIVLIFYFIYIDKNFGISLLIMITTMTIIIFKMAKKCTTFDEYKSKLYYELNDKVQDKLSNIYSIIVNDKLETEIDDSNKHENMYKKASKDYELYILKCHSILNIFVLIIMIFSLHSYYKMFNKGDKKQLMSSFLVFFNLIRYIGYVKLTLLDALSKFGVLKKMETELELSKEHLKEGSLTDFITNGVIKINDLSFSFGNNMIHKNVTMTFNNGSITTIFGKSGSGKTTLLRLLMGFYPYQGEITFDGTDIKNADLSYIRKNIATVDQSIKLFNTTIYENIKYGTDATNNDVDNIVSELEITIFKNLNADAGINGSNLSNGQKQVVMLLRAFLKKKKILILDEPTSSLDKVTKNIVIDTIKKISKNKTTIIVTHDNDVKNISDVVYHINK